MEFESKLKGNLTEAVASTLFENAGYRVVPLGIEKVVREVSTLDQKSYSKLELSQTLRLMPDLLITEVDMNKAWLVEVKYRRKFEDFKNCEKLKKHLLEQAKRWGDFWILLFVGEGGCTGYGGDHCGILNVGIKSDELIFYKKDKNGEYSSWSDLHWYALARIQDEFDKIPKAKHGTPIEKVVRVIRSFSQLD